MALPMALGLALGMVLALSGKPGVTRLEPSALGVKATSAANNAATANAADQTTNAAGNCALIVPPNPLTAAGLATPWELTGPDGQSPASSGCEQSNPKLQAFVQATILDPATGALYVYEPLVITLGSNPAVAPTIPQLPSDAVVDIMVGFNGNDIELADAPASARCFDGDGGSLFGPVAYCGSVPFYAAADQAIADGKLRIPARGDSPLTGQPCPSTRGFALADQDPSEGVTTQYLLNANGQTAQDSAANRATLPGTNQIADGGTNRLLDNFVLPALDCAPFTAPDLSAGGVPGTSQTLNELSAAANQREPIALVPESDPMTMINGAFSIWKTDLYRLGVGQPLVTIGLVAPFKQDRDGGQQADTPANYCANMLNIATSFLAQNADRFFAITSPDPAAADNLLTFLASRLSASYTDLGCASYGLKDTVSLFASNTGIATGVSLTVLSQKPVEPATEPAPQPGDTPWWG
jgi:hypothetical protein